MKYDVIFLKMKKKSLEFKKSVIFLLWAHIKSVCIKHEKNEVDFMKT